MVELETKEAELDLLSYLRIFVQRRWIILSTTIMTFLSAGLYVYTTTPIYQAKSLLLIEKARESTSRFSENTIVENTQDDYYQTQYMLLKSNTLLQRVYDQLEFSKNEQFKDPRGLEKLSAAVNIAPVKRSRLVHIEVESPDRVLAVKIANALAEAYVKQNIENQLFISRDILQALTVDARSAEGRRLQESLPAVVNNPLIQQLKAEYVKLQSQAAQLSNRYTQRHPERTAVESNMRSLAAQIRVETDKIVQALKTDLSGQLKGNNVRIVDPAKLPEFPFKPKKFQALLVSLLMGLIGGCALALLIDTLDQTVRTREDAEQRLGLPFLGLVPFLDIPKRDSPYSALTAKEPSLTGEAFRNLRTMLDFANFSESDRSFLVTSTMQEEGKSYNATNLAIAFAQLGEKVLLIDGDLRRPQIHKNFRLSAKTGISDFLASGKSVDELEGLIQGVDVPGLEALPCGPRPPNPSELLNTPRLSALIAWAKQRYDRLVVDCPPMFPIHDTLLWGRHIRAAAFVVRYGKTRVPLIRDAAQRLHGAGIRVVGVIVNAAKPGGLAYAGYRYDYHQYYKSYHPEPSPQA